MDILEVQTYLKENLQKVETYIDAALQSDIALLDQTNRRFREHPGKMVRPQLSLLVAGAGGGVTEDTLRYAAATELLHNATLMHDDVVDGATERRGLPSVFSLLGGGPAVLLGDYWLVKCIGMVLSAKDVTFRVVQLYADTLSHLAEGELLQMEKASKGDTTLQDYLRIIYGKTASLFETAAVSAAISVGASPEVEKAVGLFAREVGIAFQIKDDILDYSEEAISLGKPVGIDLREQKITQPLLSALEKVSAARQQQIRDLVSKASDHPEYVAEIQQFVKDNGGAQAAGEELDKHLSAALSALEVLPPSRDRQCLAALARFVAERNR